MVLSTAPPPAHCHDRQPEALCVSVAQGLAAIGIDYASLPSPHSWTPVLGIGSNGSPEQLARKYLPAKFPNAVIPTVRCALRDFDVVYAPLISSYGSCTGERSPLMVVTGFCQSTFVCTRLPGFLLLLLWSSLVLAPASMPDLARLLVHASQLVCCTEGNAYPCCFVGS